MNGFKLYFEDETSFIGQSIPNSDWSKAPDKKIVKMEYTLGNQTRILQGYKQYNHLIENYAVLGAGVSIRAVYLMARRKTTTLIIIFDIQKKRVFIRHVKHGNEYGKQILTGWKEGLLNNPKYH